MSSSVLKKKEEKSLSHNNNGTSEIPKNENEALDKIENQSKEDLEKLRNLLIKSKEVGEVLPSAVKQSSKKDRHLTEATLPVVEENIRQSVARNPKVLAEALFPAIGPAIRRSIAQALSTMVQSFNQTLEYSVSPKGLSWRLEAWRTGKSFGELVMLKTLLYRVEQVFLIHKETGLLLQHVAANPEDVKDADMVSAMLTAIEDFVQDSFKTAPDATLDSLKVRELSVWIEHSPDAVVAAVIRGTPPLSLRETFSEAIEQIQFNQESELKNFDGETDVFEPSRPILKKCIQFQVNERINKTSFFRPTRILAFLLSGIILLAAVFYGVEYWRWSGFVERLKTEPGIVVAESSQGIFKHSISGLRDPLAIDPNDILKDHNLSSEKVQQNWKSYYDANPAFILKRAEQLLKPPDGIKLKFSDGILLAEGNVSEKWFADSSKIVPALLGVKEFKLGGNTNNLRKLIQSESVLFTCGTTDLWENQSNKLDILANNIERLANLSENITVEICGHATKSGTDKINEDLSQTRAEKVLAEMIKRSDKLKGLQENNPHFMKAKGFGVSQDSSDCKVTFKITP